MIRVGICGYGNIGKGAEENISKLGDMELVAIFTRRDNLETKSNVPVINISKMHEWTDKIDVMLMCGGSATDLPIQVKEAAKYFNTVDSFDTHKKIPEYFEKVNKNSLSSNHTSVISGGWDPGLFSVMRTYADSILPRGKTYTFWGKGVSQGHSDAIRRVEGVKNAIQYTIPVSNAIERVKKGENPILTAREKHTRECYVVAKDGADLNKIENDIKTMPNYFDEYETTVHFVTEEELKTNHSKMPHGGFVIHSAKTGDNNNQIIEYSLKLDSNPEFTSSVLLSLVRACYRMNKKGEYGAKTMLDIAPCLLSPKSSEELRKNLL